MSNFAPTTHTTLKTGSLVLVPRIFHLVFEQRLIVYRAQLPASIKDRVHGHVSIPLFLFAFFIGAWHQVVLCF